MVGVATLSGVYAFRAVFSRPGEGSLQFVPSDALMVASMDLGPSPEQALTFKKIDDALGRNGVKEPFQRSILDVVEQSPEAKPLRELTTRSASFCLLKSADKKEEVQPVLFMPLTDGSAAKDVLTHRGYRQFWKGTVYYQLPHSKMGMMMEGDTLVISPAPWTLHEVADVASGQLEPITKLAAFESARNLEPGDANLMLFVSPKLIAEGAKQSGVSTSGWLGASVTVQDGGIALACHGKVDDPNDDSFRRIASVAPLRQDLEKVLPSGAYSVFAFSQPGKQMQAAEASLTKGNHSKDVASAKKSVADETGIDADADIVPAFMGDSVIAAYPSEAPEAGIDLLAVVDNQNNANPGDLADKFQAYVDRQATKDKDMGKNWLTHIDRPDAVAYRLSDKVQDQMRKGIGCKPSSSDPIRYDVLVAHKTVAWAKVNGAVLIATSQELLDKAIGAYEGKGDSLAADTILQPATDTADGSQVVGAISFSRIATGVRNTMNISKIDAKDRKIFEDALTAFESLKQPFAIRAKASPDGVGSASLFIPLDYDKLIDFVGGLTKK